MSDLDEHLKKHRAAVIAREEQTFRELLKAYEEVRRDLRRQILILEQKIKAAEAAGEEINPSWFLQQNRLTQLTDQVKIQIERFGGTAARITTREQQAAMEHAMSQADETIRLIVGSGQKAGGSQIGSLANPRAIENAVGMMGNGSPILEYYKQTLAPAVAEAIRSEVIKAVATGTDFRTVANRLMQAGDITRTRALATARTEVNRVRRETTRQFFQDNRDVITGWEWVANSSPRTCPACLALDGTIFELDRPFPQHVNCRCDLIAVIDGVTRPKRKLGREWFEEQSDEIKEMVIGKHAFESMQRGDVKLNDFVGWRNSKEFGKSIYTKKLSDILINKPLLPRGINEVGDMVHESLTQAGYRVSRDRALTTNSQYISVITGEDIVKIRVSDHKPNASAINILDLRPDTTMSAKDIVAKVTYEVELLSQLNAKFREQQTLRSQILELRHSVRDIWALKKTDPEMFANRQAEIDPLQARLTNLERLMSVLRGK